MTTEGVGPPLPPWKTSTSHREQGSPTPEPDLSQESPAPSSDPRSEIMDEPPHVEAGLEEASCPTEAPIDQATSRFSDRKALLAGVRARAAAGLEEQTRGKEGQSSRASEGMRPFGQTRRSALVSFARFVEAPKFGSMASALERLSEKLPPDRLMGWVVTLVISGLAFLLRWVNIDYPNQILFDETYYAKDAWSLLQLNYEGSWPGQIEEINADFAAGDPSALSTAPSWAVHPELGKWLIAAGIKLFGLNSFGWRFMPLVFGTLLVFMVIRLGRRLSRSTLVGGIAGALLAVDGLGFTMSRIALLDVFQAFFIVAAVAAVVADRDHFRNRLAQHIEALPGQTLSGSPGPFVFRPWLIVAGVLFGLGCAVKWNTLYAMAVFGVVVVVWSISARALAGAGYRSAWGLLTDGIPAFISMVVVAVGIYLVTWIPWLRATGGCHRDWGVNNPDSWLTRHLGEALASLWHWHQETYGFHTGEQMANATHNYASNPWGWPLALRTVGIYAENNIQPGDQGCTAAEGSNCMEVITAIGTPLLWWLASAAMIVALVWWLAGMDWRFSVPVLGMCSTWIPWAFTGRGAMFSFYGITMIPFMVIALAMVLGVILGPADAGPRRQSGAVIVGAIVGLIVVNFAFMYPVYTGELLTRAQWQWRMWLAGWI